MFDEWSKSFVSLGYNKILPWLKYLQEKQSNDAVMAFLNEPALYDWLLHYCNAASELEDPSSPNRPKPLKPKRLDLYQLNCTEKAGITYRGVSYSGPFLFMDSSSSQTEEWPIPNSLRDVNEKDRTFYMANRRALKELFPPRCKRCVFVLPPTAPLVDLTTNPNLYHNVIIHFFCLCRR